jgi:hypothetical protein
MNARARARTFALSSHSLNSDNIARNLHAYVAVASSTLGARATAKRVSVTKPQAFAAHAREARGVQTQS